MYPFKVTFDRALIVPSKELLTSAAVPYSRKHRILSSMIPDLPY